jgi:MFS family permease
MQSAIISYTLTVAMLIPVSGWLADRFGTRRVLSSP